MKLSAFSTDATCKLGVFGHNDDPLSVDSIQVSVFKEPNQVRLAYFLQSSNCSALETKISFWPTSPTSPWNGSFLLAIQCSSGSDEYHKKQLFLDGSVDASSLLHLLGHSCVQLWWQVSCGELFHQLIAGSLFCSCHF